tara:strand:+ start:1303 stop:1584 length:282 start_codon:yes stop_codon:yes gene_type:complete
MFPLYTHERMSISLFDGASRYGTSVLPHDIKQALEWLVIQEGKAKPSNVHKWCKKNNPVLMAFDVDTNQETLYSYRNDKGGVQMMLFNMGDVI